MSALDTSLSEAQDRSFGHTLFACAHLFDRLGQARLNAVLGETLARPSVMRLVPYLTEQGIRSTDLARKIDISKQAVSQTLAQLTERGLVEFIPDPTDGRARLVRMTAEGRRLAGAGLQALADVQEDLEQSVGREVVASTFAGLQAIHRALLAVPPSTGTNEENQG